MRTINCQSEEQVNELNVIYAAECFSKLPASAQDAIIDLMKSLLSEQQQTIIGCSQLIANMYESDKAHR